MAIADPRGWLLAGAAMVMVLPGWSQAPGVALVSDLAGTAHLKGHKEPLALMAELPPNLPVTLKKGARITFVSLRSGAETTLTGPGRFRLDPQGEAHGLANGKRRQVAVLSSVRLRQGALAQASVVMRAVPDAGGAAMTPGPFSLSATPDFRWRPAGADATYHFRLQDPQGQVLFELTQGECEIKVPEHLALAAGTAYTWVLDTRRADGSEARQSGQVQVVAKAVREALLASRPALDAPFSERLVYAALLEQQELHQEARAYWQSLARDRPDDPGLARLAAN